MSQILVYSVRNTLKTHGLRPKGTDLVEKCSGCPWIGFDHSVHLAEAVIDVIADYESREGSIG